jgi:hypothetical protein
MATFIFLSGSFLFWSQEGKDHTGGEFVLTEQTPRAQSKAEVIHPNQGDALIFTTNFRPVRGSRGYFKAKMKHGVSEVTSGIRLFIGDHLSRCSVIEHSKLSAPVVRSLIRKKTITYAGNSPAKIYGTLSCPSGKRMKNENRVFFTSVDEAMTAGFRPCGNCMRKEI